MFSALPLVASVAGYRICGMTVARNCAKEGEGGGLSLAVVAEC